MPLQQNLSDIVFGLDSVDEYSCGRARRYGGSGLADADASFKTIIGRFADRHGVSIAANINDLLGMFISAAAESITVDL